MTPSKHLSIAYQGINLRRLLRFFFLSKAPHDNMCSHNTQERTLQGTWYTEDLQKAVEKGYQILKIHEVWHWPENQRKTGLFAPYVNKFLKAKQESAGWPSCCETLEQQEAYIAEYEAKEGIRLENIANNPGRKAVAKVMLNSFWGEFGEADNKPQTTTRQNVRDWEKLMTDDSVIVKSVNVYDEDVLEVVTVKKGACAPNMKGNFFIALLTTSLAGLKLYDALDTLKERVLYYDTDSVLYRWQPGQVKLPLGRYLGEFTDELEAQSLMHKGQMVVKQSVKAKALKTIMLSNKC